MLEHRRRGLERSGTDEQHTAANVAGWSIPLPTDLVFYNGVAFCFTGAVADNDATAAASGVAINYVRGKR